MRIGIDISQLVYEKTGVANFLGSLVRSLIESDSSHEYVLFCSSMRKNFQFPISNFKLNQKNVTIKQFKFPPSLLDLLWNKLHIMPVEWLIGDVDIFISSDWTQPPRKKAKMATILYDLIVYTYPKETDGRIVATQKRRLEWVKKECDAIFCISDATRKDAERILKIPKEKLFVAYPGGVV